MPLITVRLDQDEKEWLEQYAKLRGLTVSETLRKILALAKVIEMSSHTLTMIGTMQSKLNDSIQECVAKCMKEHEKFKELVAEFKKGPGEQMKEMGAQMLPVFEKIREPRRRRGRPPSAKKGQTNTVSG